MTDQNKTESSLSANKEYIRILGAGEEQLDQFVEALAKFDREFCESMIKGHDYTLKLEVHGNKGVLIHTRTMFDTFRRPEGADKKIAAKK